MKNISLLILLGIGFLISCQKEIGPAVSASTSDDSSLLLKYIELDTTMTAPDDTLTKLLFEYDNLKRVIRQRSFSYDNGIIIPADSYEHLFSYNATDTLPSKEIINGVDAFSGLPVTTTKYYTFSNGRLTVDSTVYQESTEVHKYFYSLNRITDSIFIYDDVQTLMHKNFRIVHQQTTGNLVLTQKDTIVYYLNNIPVPSDTVSYNHSFSYDTKRNPFNKMSYLSPFYIKNEFPTIFGRQANNMLTSSQIEANQSGVYPYQFVYAYKYNANDLPASVVIVDQSDPTNYVKGLFFYGN